METVVNDELVQHLTARINELEEENKELIKDKFVTRPACCKAVETFGKEHTMLAAIEVMGELSVALTKVIRGRCDLEIIDRKIADVEILMECLKTVFVNLGRVRRRKVQKIKVLMGGIKDGTAVNLGGDENAEEY